MLPQDPNILFSYINTKLRDQYASLDELCDDLDADREEVTRRLGALGRTYDAGQNRFV